MLKPKKIPATYQLLPMHLSTAPKTAMLMALLKPMRWAPFQRFRASPTLLGSASADFLKNVFRMTNPDQIAAAVAKTNATKSPGETVRWRRFILWTMKRTQSQARKKPTWGTLFLILFLGNGVRFSTHHKLIDFCKSNAAAPDQQRLGESNARRGRVIVNSE